MQKDNEKEQALGMCVESKTSKPEIIAFVKKWRITVMGILDCRLKGTGAKQIHGDYVLTWSGVDITTRATHGVGFFLTPRHSKECVGNRVYLGEDNKIPSKRRTGDHSLHPDSRTL